MPLKMTREVYGPMLDVVERESAQRERDAIMELCREMRGKTGMIEAKFADKLIAAIEARGKAEP